MTSPTVLSVFGVSTVMEINGLTCEVNMPRALKQVFGSGDMEVSQNLPEYNRRPALLVEDFNEAPPDWQPSSPGVASYMVPIIPEHGLWLDFNGNWKHTHDIAIVVSIQGINAITGMRTVGVKLEQFREKCPVHDVAFIAGNLCSTCNRKWDPQNYLATTGAPRGGLWLDGFRTEDGVRQFVFTTDVTRSVARAVIGEDRVHALSVAFYLSKEPKPPVPTRDALSSLFESGVLNPYGDSSYGGGLKTMSGGGFTMRGMAPSIEVAAGAKIRQRVDRDPKSPDYWQPTPAGQLVINYCDVETSQRVIASGRKRTKEGWLDGVPHGTT